MEITTSADGTRTAYHRFGTGRPVVIVGGALSTARSGTPLAEAFGTAGLQGVAWDRRGRGASGDTRPYTPEREVEDLTAVIEAVAGPDPIVLGHSSGAVLALLAAGAGVAMSRLFASEPPLRFGGPDEPDADLADRLQDLVDRGQPDEAVVTFFRDNVRLPAPVVDQMRASEEFAAMVPLAQTTVYDTLVVAAASTPTPAMLDTGVPTTILRGDPAMPMLVAACERLAAAMGAELVVVPESHNHAVDPTGTVREVLARI